MDNQGLFIISSANYKQLTEEEFNDLFIKFKNGDERAYDKIFLHNLKLVYHEINTKFNSLEVEKEDLVQIGNMGLIKALNSFDLKLNLKFSTYAIHCIDNEIYKYIKLNKKNTKLDVTDFFYITSEGEEDSLVDVLPSSESIVEDYIKKEQNEIIMQLIKKFPKRNQEIILLYFGFYNNKKYTFEEIGKMYNMTRANASRIVLESLEKIKKQLKEIDKPCEKRKITTLYEFFSDYSKEEVDAMVLKLSLEEQALIKRIYGDNLNNCMTTLTQNSQDYYNFYRVLMPKMRKLLPFPNIKIKTIYEFFPNYTKEEVNKFIDSLNEYDKRIINLRYCFDLEHPKDGIVLSQRQSNHFFRIINLIANSLENNEPIKRRKLKTIYGSFKGYSKEEIDNVILSLKEEEKALIRKRYGSDLDNPIRNEEWTSEDTYKFYSILIKKIRYLLKKNQIKEEVIYKK